MNPFAPLVPRLWSADEALAAVHLLRQFIDAIWEVHGAEMAAEVAEAPERWRLDELLDDVPDDDVPDDDLPF